jgi:cytochrome c-550 PedF
MKIRNAGLLIGLLVLASGLTATQVLGHGDVQPQPVNTQGLKPLGDEWHEVNPYRGDPTAIRIGESGYTQNCARCHGIDAVSGGLAPDLRFMDKGEEGDEWYMLRTRKGFTQNGAVKMPGYEGILSQEAMWAIRSWLDTKTR